jgi:hypothetical protein
MAESREDNIYFARLSEQGERYEDMIKYMKKVAMVSTFLLTQANKERQGTFK